jgi:peptidoglycan/LPS O-acetylase OafA/YrhL
MRVEHISSLDGVRAVAITSVLLFHGTYGHVKGGWLGVDLFFVLSGYLITSLLQKEWDQNGTISLGDFYLRRALRLLPALLILISIVNIFWEASSTNRLVASVAALFYAANLVDASLLGHFSHLWSLAVEEHFYLIWPLLAPKFLFRSSKQDQISILVALILAAAGFRLIAHHIDLSFWVIKIDPYRFTIGRVDAILVGCLMAISLRNLPPQTTAKPLLVLVLSVFGVLVLQLSMDSVLWRNGGFVLSNLLCMAIVFLAVSQPKNFLLSNGISVWIGKRSYGIYVYHFAIFPMFEAFRELHSGWNFVLVLCARIMLTLFCAELSYRLLEIPILTGETVLKIGLPSGTLAWSIVVRESGITADAFASQQ